MFYLSNFSIVSAQDVNASDTSIQKKEVVILAEKKSKALDALFSLNKQIQKTAVEKSKTHQQMLTLEEELSLTKDQIEELKVDLIEQKKSLRDRLISMGQISEGALFYLLLNSANFSQIESDLKTLRTLTQYDIVEIKKYLSAKKTLEIKRQKVLARIEKLKKLTIQLDKNETQLGQSLSLKTKLIQSIQKNQNLTLQLAQQMNDKDPAKNYSDSGVFDSFKYKSFYDLKGQLDWPIQGNVLHKFGFLSEPNQKYRISHKGLFIEAPKNTAVKAVAEGEVAFVGNLPTFGKTVIIDHGDHFYSLYSMNSEFNVAAGDKIKTQQIIAKSGQSLLDKVDGLYFEIRHFSEPNDPHRWMKGIHNETATQ